MHYIKPSSLLGKIKFLLQLRMFMPAPSIERKLSVEKKGNQFNRDDTVWHFPMILG
jgi:hypothetical protein